MKGGTFHAVLLIFALAVAPAEAKVDEVRLGVAYHDIRTHHGDMASSKEAGPDVQGEVVFHAPGWLRWAGAPRPYLAGSLNTQGNTSYAGAGLYWRWEFAQRWAFEPGFGYVIHNGELNIPEQFAPGSPEATAFEQAHQLLGSRDLFRTSFALEHEISPRTAWQIYFEHMSHGQVLGEGRNQGLNNAGIRFLYRFNTDAAD